MSRDKAKNAAAEAALDYVQDGMRIGLGTGSTAGRFVELLGARVRDGLAIQVVPTSEVTAAQASQAGMKLIEADERPLDLAVDGADEFDDDLNLIKGGGGALLREKIVARAARRFIVLADYGKRVQRLGVFPLPIEIIEFGVAATMALITQTARECGVVDPEGKLRLDASGVPVRTDNGNLLCDLACRVIADASALAMSLSELPGVVEHGLFVGMADSIVIGTADGQTRSLR